VPKHNDDDPVMVGYASSKNISFRNSSSKGEELGVTWGEWREMTEKERDEVIEEYVNELVQVWVLEDEN
jgi:hypothetical protein